MLGLLIDTSYLYASTAIMKDGIILNSQINTIINQQTKDLNIMIEESMKKLGVNFQMLNYEAVSVGPGRFIGLRVGISTANALHLALKIPLLGISNFDIVAYHYQKTRIGVVLDASSHYVYFQEYQNNMIFSKAQVVNKTQLLKKKRDICLVGNIDQIDNKFILCMEHFAKFAHYKLKNIKNIVADYIRPQYVINHYSVTGGLTSE